MLALIAETPFIDCQLKSHFMCFYALYKKKRDKIIVKIPDLEFDS